jgi:hypothetical protein
MRRIKPAAAASNTWRATLWLVVACAAAGACEQVNSENIRKWEGTQKGPGKLEKAFANPKLDPRLRAEAAVSLENIEQHLKVQSIWQGLPAPQRAELAPHLAAVHGARIDGGSEQAARSSRDALFELRGALDGEPRRQFDLTIARALTKDLRAGRLSEGRHNAQKIAATVGPNVMGPVVQSVLQDPTMPFAATVELVSKLGDPTLNRQAGAALTKRMQTKPEQPPELWAALVGLGTPEIGDMLKNRLRSAPEAEALATAKALRARPRVPELLPLALELAADQQLALTVREEMFGLIESLGGPAAQEGLVKIVADPAQPDIIRYRSFAGALVVGHTAALAPALQALPPTATYKPTEVTESLVKPVVQLGPIARESLLTALQSQSAIARLTVVLALEKLGIKDDAATLAKLSGDRTAPAGFARDVTVGKEAARVAKALRAGKPPPDGQGPPQPVQ